MFDKPGSSFGGLTQEMKTKRGGPAFRIVALSYS